VTRTASGRSGAEKVDITGVIRSWDTGRRKENVAYFCYPLNYKGYIGDHDSKLKETINRFGKNFIQNNKSGGNVAVAVIVNIITFDNLLYVKCGEGKTCGFGYGHIAAPKRIDYEHIRYSLSIKSAYLMLTG